MTNTPTEKAQGAAAVPPRMIPASRELAAVDYSKGWSRSKNKSKREISYWSFHAGIDWERERSRTEAAREKTV